MRASNNMLLHSKLYSRIDEPCIMVKNLYIRLD